MLRAAGAVRRGRSTCSRRGSTTSPTRSGASASSTCSSRPLPDRGGPGVPRWRGRPGPGGRPGLAGAGLPGDPARPVRRGGPPGSPPACDAGPTTPAVWRARLDWAVAADRPRRGREALAHVPADADAAADGHEAPRLVRRPTGRSAGRAPGPGGAPRARPGGPPGPRPADGAGRRGRASPTWPRTIDGSEGRAQSRPRGVCEARQVGDPRPRAGELARSGEALGRRFDAERLVARRREPTSPAGPLPGRAPASPRRRRWPTCSPTSPSPRGRAGPRPRPGPSRPAVIPRFVDDAEAVGLRFVHDNGRTPTRLIPPESTSGGVGLLDYDGDGWLDVYCVQGGPFPPDPGSPRRRRPPLPQPGRRDLRGRDRAVRASAPWPGATGTASRWATTTTTATPTCSSPAGGRTPCIATAATARSRT